MRQPVEHQTGMFTETHCELCKAQFRPTDLIAEMYDPDDADTGALVVHAACGKRRGMEMA